MERTPEQLFLLNNLAIMRSPMPKRLNSMAMEHPTGHSYNSSSIPRIEVVQPVLIQEPVKKPAAPLFSMKPPAPKHVITKQDNSKAVPKLVMKPFVKSSPLQMFDLGKAKLPSPLKSNNFSNNDYDLSKFITLDEWFIIPCPVNGHFEFVLAGKRSSLNEVIARSFHKLSFYFLDVEERVRSGTAKIYGSNDFRQHWIPSRPSFKLEWFR